MIFTAIFIYVVFILQTTLFPFLAIKGATPDLLLISLISFLFLDRRPQAQFAAGLSGFLVDIFSPFRFGTYILLYFSVYLIAGHFLRRYLASATLVAWLGITVVASLITSVPVILETLSLQTMFLRIIYTVVLSLVGYFIVIFSHRKKIIGV